MASLAFIALVLVYVVKIDFILVLSEALSTFELQVGRNFILEGDIILLILLKAYATFSSP